MTWTYDAVSASDRDRVRLLCTDTDSANPIFTDEEIAVFLDLEDDSLRRAAALAMETIASQEVLVLKVVKRLDLQTDGRAVSDSLLKRAAALREQADEQEARDGGLFDWAEQVPNQFAARERLYNQMLRGA